MVQSTEEITGRGGAAMCYMHPIPEKLSHAFLLTGGASRQEQFNDFWLLTVGLTSQGRIVTKEKLKVDTDDYTPRNAHCAIATPDNKVLIFGGQDSEKFV